MAIRLSLLDEPGPSAFRPLYNASGHDNHVEIERMITSLLVDRDYCMFDMPIMQLMNVLRSHGVNTSTITSNEDAVSSTLDHIMNGKCFLPSSNGTACNVVRRGIRDVRSMIVLAAESVLTYIDNPDHLRYICHSLGYTQSDLSRRVTAYSMKRLIEMSRDQLSTCFNIPRIISQIDALSVGEMKVICRAHAIDVSDIENLPVLNWIDVTVSRMIQHFCTGVCEVRITSNDSSVLPSCQRSLGNELLLQLSLLDAVLANNATVRPMRHLLRSLNIEYDPGDSVRVMKTRLRAYVAYVRRGKDSEVRNARRVQKQRDERHDVHVRHCENLERVRSAWPQIVPESVKRVLLSGFQSATSTDCMRTRVCAVCAEEKYHSDFSDCPTPISDGRLHLYLLKGSYPIGFRDPFADDECLRGLMLDPKGVVLDPDGEHGLWTCGSCYRILSRKFVPRLALANNMFIGDIPECLKGLTVVEEAMIAHRRAKCWIIHLNANGEHDHVVESGASHGTRLPITQRGIKGHIVVYPSEPQNLGSVLPPTLEDVVSPMCVVFTGSSRPSAEWLLTKAKPLLIQREKVRDALIWLKQHNPLYADISIEHARLNSLPEESVAPVEISVEPATESTNAIGSGYSNSYGEDAEVQVAGDQSESWFEKAVIADLDVMKMSSAEMAAAALSHLRDHKAFLQIPHGPQPSNEYEDFDLFPLLYPTLFPYGVGGFEHPLRRRAVGMKVHARHLFSTADKRFQEHYSFLFTVFNVLQRRIVNQKARLKVKKSYFEEFASTLQNLSDNAFSSVTARVAKGDYTTAYSDEERLVLRLMKEVNLVSQPVPGSSASKQVLRNQIRGMMTDLGLPSFYITINPADIHNPLVRFIAGEQIDVDEILDDQQSNSWKQNILIAKNPFIAAKFFHVYMEAFFKCLLGFDKQTMSCKNGILGVTKGYFGCVEAQGRGSLHCHLLVWLEGALDPQEIKDRVIGAGDQEFGLRLCEFIDDIIKSSSPDVDVSEAEERQLHPCRIRGPLVPPSGCSADQEALYKASTDSDVHALLKHCQRHKHSHTCYKYWKGGDERKECRFNLDESHHVDKTTIDPVSGEMNFRIQDGMVNNFCSTILQAMRCNMDIKFIGSGASAKAILFYISDYITKSQLPAHAAYQTLQAAVQKLEKRGVVDDSFTAKAKRMLVKCANSLISQQELSAPQVASYLMDYGDHYTSHNFRNLFWKSFEGHVAQQTDVAELRVQDDDEEEVTLATEDDESEDFVAVERNVEGHISQKGSQLLDYRMRGNLFQDLSIWDYVAYIDKVKMDRKTRQKTKKKRTTHQDEGMAGDVMDASDEDIDDIDEDDPEADEMNDDDRGFTWNCSNPRAMFRSAHPEAKSHFSRRRRDLNRFVPVLVGPRVYRRDIPDDRENYCRLMLILFKPWRDAVDLKMNSTTWEDAFLSFRDTAQPSVLKVIENMQRLHECKDSRDKHYANRRNRIRGSNSIAEEFVSSATHEDETFMDAEDVVRTDSRPLDHVLAYQEARSRYVENKRREAAAAVTAGVHSGLYNNTDINAGYDDASMASDDSHQIQLLHEPEKIWKKHYANRRKEAKKKLISDGTYQAPAGINTSSSLPNIEIGQVNAVDTNIQGREHMQSSINLGSIPLDQSVLDGRLVLQHVLSDFTLNTEQAAAFTQIAEHSLSPRSSDLKPLQMFLGGPGGTGKSRVLDALRSFFDRRNQSRRLRVVAYTGSAATNVGGVTIHAALQMSQPESAEGVKNKAHQELVDMWRGVDYLFIDEVSMVGCKFLHKISRKLMKAKEFDGSFGGISIVFAGDFCQLPPIQDTALYTSASRSSGYASTSLTKSGQRTVGGRLLWLDISCSILLHEQMRQAGAHNNVFRDLLNRVRVGRCSSADIEILKARVLQNLPHEQRAKLSSEWGNVPIITSSNATKDALNEKAVLKFANDRKLTVHYYYARDFAKKAPVADDVQEALYDLHSGDTNQLMGKLPLVIGMPVILTHNYDVPGGVVNGTEGVLKAVRYKVDERGRRFATLCVVSVPNSTGEHLQFLDEKDVAAFCESASFTLTHRQRKDVASFSRHQLPILPAFAFTDYKAQGRSMDRVIVDLSSCRTLQSVYVMLSRAKSLDGLLILREFEPDILLKPVNGDLRVELQRLALLAAKSYTSLPQHPACVSPDPQPVNFPPSSTQLRRRRSSTASPGPTPRRRRVD